MKKLFASLFILLWAAMPSLAQSPEELRLVVGQPSLILVPTAGQVDLQFTAINGPMYITVRSERDSEISVGLFHSDNTPVEGISYIPYDSYTTLLEVSNATAGDYILVVGSFGKGGYARVEYRISPLSEVRADERIFTDDPLSIAFYEPFTDNNRGWWTGDTDNVNVMVADDALVFSFQGPGRALTGFDSLPGTHRNYFSIQASLHNTAAESSVIGIVARLVDSHNFYLYQVSPERNAGRFLALQEGEWTVLVDWFPLPAHEESYRLEILVLTNTYILLLDGHPLAHVQDRRFTSGGAGLYLELPPDSPGTDRPAVYVDEFLIGTPPQDRVWPLPILPAQAAPTPAELIGTEEAP